MAEQAPSTIEPDAVRQALESILSSRHFVNAPKKKKFLRLICDFYLEGRAHELNEHMLGYDVFGRGSGYNPSDDPIVRVFAHEIRKKLEAYYASEGAADPIRLDIPAGSYQPVFSRHLPEPAIEVSEQTLPLQPQIEVEPSRRRFSPRGLALSLALSFLVIGFLWLAVLNRQLRQQVAEAGIAKDPATYGAVWLSFLTNTNPPL
ncbi:MAG TPA: hypothetical protein VF762_08635, partial [Blastocatellia bacterium]